MDLEEEFKKIIEYNYLYVLNDDIIIPYILNCFKSICDFLTEKTQASIRYTYNNTDMIVQGFYKIGIENCQKEYEHYNSILRFKAQYQLDYQIMKQTRQKYHNIEFTEFTKYKEFEFCQYEHLDRNSISESDMEFYINKYKFYNNNNYNKENQ